MENVDKNKEILRVFDLWMTERESGNMLGNYLARQNIKKVGIYGYGILGRHLLYELEKADIQIAWIIDRRMIQASYLLMHPPDKKRVPDVDLVIITAITDFKEIEGMLSSKTDSPIISLQEIVEEMRIFHVWKAERENNNKIADYLTEREMKKVGIYGNNLLGKELLSELRKGSIEIIWVSGKEKQIPMLMEEEFAPEVDVVIVTVLSDYEEIEEKICTRIDSPLISLQEIVEEMKYWREGQ